MAVRPIDANELYRIEKLLDTDIVRQDKVALNLLEQVLYDIQHAPTLTQPNEPVIRGFDVIDTKTGEYPDLWDIALKEDWAKDLMYCDMEGFAIEEDGTLLLLDECGKFRYCPIGRFEVRRPPEGDEKSEMM